MLKPAIHPPGPGARALYLGAREKKQVTCTDEALVVRNARQQTLRYPLERISRVVSSITTDWNGSALALCLKNSIGITWLDGQGNALGTCYPTHRWHPKFSTAVELLTETQDGYLQYQHWQRSRRMAVMIRWGKTHAERIDLAQWENVKRNWVYGENVDIHLPPALRGQCLAWVGSQLAREGLTPQLWGPDAQAIDLDQALCELLWAEMNLCAGAVAGASSAEEPVTVLFERWNALNGSALALHFSSLYRVALKALNASSIEP